MTSVRIGIIGLGNMGASHAASIQAGKVPRLGLTAVTDVDGTRAARVSGVKAFASADELIASGSVDAVLIATPHYSHTTIGINALKAGLHVMVEKPVSVHKADAERLLAAHTHPRQVFAAMFNQRTDHYYLKLRQLIQSGELGKLRRVNWIITNWFRTEKYYASGGWRATWAGEGGGVLLNQCPHNLDLFQWLFGMPARVRAFCGWGRYHPIEVEDDVTAYLEFPDGATAVFITSTGEAPGTNRLEITAERGKIVYENDRILFLRNETPMSEFSRTSPLAFAAPETWTVEIPAKDHGGQHNEILKNFTDAILDGVPLISPAAEGIHSVELANAMLMSAWTDQTIALPLDGKQYERLLKAKIAGSKVKKKMKKTDAPNDDFTKSFGR
jgi:predicted dehydrogenase